VSASPVRAGVFFGSPGNRGYQPSFIQAFLISDEAIPSRDRHLPAAAQVPTLTFSL